MKEPETTVRFFKTGILKTTLTKQENQSKNNKRKRKKIDKKGIKLNY